MNSFDFYSPTYFVFGRDRETEAGAYVKKFGGSRVLVLYGGQSAKRTGLLDRVNESLRSAGLASVELGGIKPNPKSDMVYEGIELCRREQVDFLLAVGGGSVDVYKRQVQGSFTFVTALTIVGDGIKSMEDTAVIAVMAVSYTHLSPPAAALPPATPWLPSSRSPATS